MTLQNQSQHCLTGLTFPERYKAGVVSAVESINIGEIIQVIDLFKQTRAQGRNILICGSTGSACTAAKVLSDMMTRASFYHQSRFRSLALHSDTGESFSAPGVVSTERVFVEQLKTFAGPGDVAVGISACDCDAPLIQALEYGKSVGCKTVALTGSDGGKLGTLADIAIRVNSTNLGTVEDAHLVICHMIGSYFLEFDHD